MTMPRNDFSLTLLSEETQLLVSSNESLESSIKSHFIGAQKGLNKALIIDNPYGEFETELIDAESQFDPRKLQIERLKNDASLYADFTSHAKLPEDNHWQNKISAFNNPKKDQKKLSKKALSLSHQHLLQTWRKAYDEVFSAWELEAIRQYQEAIIKKLEAWLDYIKQLSESLSSLGLDPGYLLDFSEGSMSLSDIKQLKKWAKYLAEDEGLKSLCDLLGRLRQMAQSEKMALIKNTIQLPEMVFDNDYKQEIVGLSIGRDLEHVVPSELALLADPETSILFDLKYVESNLLCFDMSGISTNFTEEEIEKEQTIDDNKKGPMLICVDTSGSMHGQPETIAKALALYLSSQARKENRDCYLINFSTCIDTIDLGKNYSFKSLLNFLQMSFHGGTDVAPAMRHAIEQMQEETYENADLLIISDFIMSSLPHDTLDLVEQQREEGSRFYSLCIGNSFMTERLKTHFDSEWVYDPSSSSVSELLKFGDEISYG